MISGGSSSAKKHPGEPGGRLPTPQGGEGYKEEPTCSTLGWAQPWLIG